MESAPPAAASSATTNPKQQARSIKRGRDPKDEALGRPEKARRVEKHQTRQEPSSRRGRHGSSALNETISKSQDRVAAEAAVVAGEVIEVESVVEEAERVTRTARQRLSVAGGIRRRNSLWGSAWRANK
jgi:hypothetical protein